MQNYQQISHRWKYFLRGDLIIKQNLDVRVYASDRGVFLWQIAEEMGVSEATLTRKLRKPLPETEREKIFSVIDELTNGGEKNG